ncbi:basic region leucine zipper [Oesophagostomum dentatum]|uniref:Basic region leucine zipper n=1 Tax=Oesophagostomum dentatum TaxID=61180 RepID=A0A0B1SR35_OESDE|nr:basic region leucine zipper [Oesophagostomum dentatum]
MTLHKPDVSDLHSSEEPKVSTVDQCIPREQASVNGERADGFHQGYAAHLQGLERQPGFPSSIVDPRIFERQDSLARAATLQECDRVRDHDGILDFLESTMNIEDYLEDITRETGVPPEEVDLDDYELQKCNILYDDKIRAYENYDPFAHDIGLHEQLVPPDYVPKTPTPLPTIPETIANIAPVKVEPTWESSVPSTSTAQPTTTKRGGRTVQPPPDAYTPTTTARKYRLKTPQERNNTSYKVKRARNNDAVRKSRSKAKAIQAMKDKQLEEALLEVSQLKEKLRVANERLAKCRCRL